MEYLPLVPSCLLPERHEKALFVEVDWLNSDEYAENLSQLDHNTLVILDNSVHLNGVPHASEVLLNYAEEIPRCCVIGPDEQGDREATLDLTESFMEDVKSMGIYRPTVMLVPQGESFGDLLRCFDEMYLRFRPDGMAITLSSSWCLDDTSCECRTGGVSEYLKVRLGGDDYLERAHHRIRMLDQLLGDTLDKGDIPYHLLGLTHGLELAAINRLGWNSWFSSCDSAKAYTLAKAGVTIGKDGNYRDKRTVKVFDPMEVESKQVLDRTRVNISRLQGLLA